MLPRFARPLPPAANNGLASRNFMAASQAQLSISFSATGAMHRFRANPQTGIDIKDEGVLVVPNADCINFRGDDVDALRQRATDANVDVGGGGAQSLTIDYLGNGNIDRITFAGGRLLVFSYLGNDNIDTIVETPGNITRTFNYNGNDDLIGITVT